jgi:predicted nucleic acid-binding protein
VNKSLVILDTGPLVALINRADNFHAWAKAQFGTMNPPVITCEAVIAESWFLLRHLPAGQQALLKLIHQGLIDIQFSLAQELPEIVKLTARYANVPMSLADACLVRMTELHASSVVMTLDSDFSVYRKRGRQVIRLIIP